MESLQESIPDVGTEKWKRDAQAFAIESMLANVRETYTDIDEGELRTHLESLPARYVLDVASAKVAVHHFQLVKAAEADPLGLPIVDIVCVEWDGSFSETSSGASLELEPGSIGTRGRTTLSSSNFSNPGLGRAGTSAAFGFSPSQGSLGDAKTKGKKVYEFTFAAGKDRTGLLADFSQTVSTKANQDIAEAHSFSTRKGTALTVMVTTGDEITSSEHMAIQAELKHYGRLTALDEGGRGGAMAIGCPECSAKRREACTCSREGLRSRESRWSGAGGTRGAIRRQQQRLAGLLDLGEWEVDSDKVILLGMLAEGPACSVHRASYYGSEVACKVLRGSVGITDFGAPIPEAMEKPLLMFAGEAAVLRKLRHKNVAKLVGIGRTQGGDLCLLFEYLAGGRIDVLIPQVHMTPPLHMHAALVIAREAARGMVYLHSSRIIHRDLRAASLIVSETGTVNLGGFGSARQAPGGDELMTGETGTYRWMAPEVVKHERYSEKADVYSFGIMMWELVTGRTPYEDLAPIQAALRVVKEGYRPAFPPGTPPGMSALAARCWCADPGGRPEFEEVLSELDTLLEASPVQGQGGSAGEWEREWARIVQYGVQLVDSQLAMARHQLTVAASSGEEAAGTPGGSSKAGERPKSRGGGISAMFKRRISTGTFGSKEKGGEKV